MSRVLYTESLPAGMCWWGRTRHLKISDFGMARDENIYIKTRDGKLPLLHGR